MIKTINYPLIITILMLAGCAGAPIQQAEVKPAKEIQQGVDAKPIQLRKVVVKLRRGEEIGQSQVGLLCIPAQKIEWKGGRVNVDDEEFTDVFREELEKYNYPVVGDPNALFEDPTSWQAELLVAGLINKMQIKACYPMAGFGNFSDSKGAAYIKVNWQIYGQLERKVIYEVSTEGSYEATSNSSMGIERALTNAFSVAVQNLLADPGFHNLVSRRSGNPILSEASSYEPLLINQDDSIASLTHAMDSSVTIFAGTGHGSGFIVSNDGHVITNEHVVREARFVRVRLANGREVLGDVLRTNSAQDVALIKLRERNLPSVLLRTGKQPQIGSEVYAIGTPRMESLDLTVTKGIISAYRDERGQKLIQSDVQIHPGNSGGPLVNSDGQVVGVAVAGIFVGNASQNLNFFLPIDDAIKGLNIVVR